MDELDMERKESDLLYATHFATFPTRKFKFPQARMSLDLAPTRLTVQASIALLGCDCPPAGRDPSPHRLQDHPRREDARFQPTHQLGHLCDHLYGPRGHRDHAGKRGMPDWQDLPWFCTPALVLCRTWCRSTTWTSSSTPPRPRSSRGGEQSRPILFSFDLPDPSRPTWVISR